MKSNQYSRHKSRSPAQDFTKKIAAKERRKLYARQAKPFGGVWFGFGFAGLIGWSVVVPTLLGMLLGTWIDSQFPSSMSWTLALMLGGLTLGCLVAWQWISQEQERIARSQPNPNSLADKDADVISQDKGRSNDD